ncbi:MULTISPECIES: hypothetical protein [unclassified Haloferax]|uniref:DUF7095 family protein n=1 Tax=unclassified Haloferax TaxID=2625095 RepID=UPI0002B22015|nr:MULTISPECIES: hypothetical protein [unclassified Haloferax]ELZ58467.1 hypothetical protein C460_09797 [Haloferax sp. ATCC BAA-646]ELZ63100.1 hypothetical protein C458_16521 [Haloferax sp. ATCC BAA-644]ELZ63272.1 hypothetical protein C459_11174 [Haloferax sp. ATCC BAA-645]
MDRDAALDRVDAVVDAVESETLPVPVREVWVYGDVALGLDPLDRLDVYVTKDILLRGDPDAAESFERSHGVKGVGKSVRAEWAREHPDLLRANANGYAAPEKCLAAHLLPDDDEPVHLEVCNASFEDNVTQRLKGAVEREAYEQILDPRGVCLYADGQRSSDAMSKLRNGEFAFPTLSGALEMLGLEGDEAETAVEAMRAYRAEQTGTSVRGDVV